MSAKSVQTIFSALVSLIFVLSVYRLGRKQKLSFRYTVGWMVLGALGIFAGIVSPIAEPIADKLEVTPAALLGIGAVVLLVTLCVQLSISISGLQEQVRRLTEEAAFLRLEIEEVATKDQSN